MSFRPPNNDLYRAKAVDADARAAKVRGNADRYSRLHSDDSGKATSRRGCPLGAVGGVEGARATLTGPHAEPHQEPGARARRDSQCCIVAGPGGRS